MGRQEQEGISQLRLAADIIIMYLSCFVSEKLARSLVHLGAVMASGSDSCARARRGNSPRYCDSSYQGSFPRCLQRSSADMCPYSIWPHRNTKVQVITSNGDGPRVLENFRANFPGDRWIDETSVVFKLPVLPALIRAARKLRVKLVGFPQADSFFVASSPFCFFPVSNRDKCSVSAT